MKKVFFHYQAFNLKEMKKEITISFMGKSGNYPAGVYMLKKPNILFPVVYFRKPKSAKISDYHKIIRYFINKN